MTEPMGHEKLHTYQKALRVVARNTDILSRIPSGAAVLDQFERATESMVTNIAIGNSTWFTGERLKYFDYAMGSILESAACLDICRVRDFISLEEACAEKDLLEEVVRMLHGLRKSPPSTMRESRAEYDANPSPSMNRVRFAHESLDVYRAALDLVRWMHEETQSPSTSRRLSRKLDIHITAAVLNVAEGNGQYADLDHRRFLGIALASTLKAGAVTDLLQAREHLDSAAVEPGKRLMRRVVSMLTRMQSGYDDE